MTTVQYRKQVTNWTGETFKNGGATAPRLPPFSYPSDCIAINGATNFRYRRPCLNFDVHVRCMPSRRLWWLDTPLSIYTFTNCMSNWNCHNLGAKKTRFTCAIEEQLYIYMQKTAMAEEDDMTFKPWNASLSHAHHTHVLLTQ